MKRVLLIILSVLTVVSCNRESDTQSVSDTIIQMQFKCVSKEKGYLEIITPDKTIKMDSVKIRNNKRLKFKLKNPADGFYQIRTESNKVISLIVHKGNKLFIRADLDNINESLKIEGSDESVLLNSIRDEHADFLTLKDSLNVKFDFLQEKNDTAGLNEIVSEYKTAFDNYKKKTLRLIINNTNSLAALAAIYLQVDPGVYLFETHVDMNYYKILRDSLTKYYPENQHVKMLEQDYADMYARYKQRKLLSSAQKVTTGLPNIILPDKYSKDITLSDLKGKYVLLTFWASWDKTSVSQFSSLKSIYSKYKQKGFEIYQVSFDHDIRMWLSTLLDEDLPWKNVCDTTFPESNVRKLYNVSSLPANYLLDKEQDDILGKNLSMKDLERKLSYLFKN